LPLRAVLGNRSTPLTTLERHIDRFLDQEKER
jgi:hypothetical protein